MSMSDQELAVWYNDNVIYPDKVRLNRRTKQDQSQACLSYGLQGGGKPKVNIYYYNHYSLTCGRAYSCSAIGKQACHCSRVLAAFWTDIKMIFATVLGRKMTYAGEEI